MGKVKVIRRVLLVILMAVFAYSGYRIGVYLYDGYASGKLNDRMKQQYEAAQQMQEETNPSEQGQFMEEEQSKASYRRRFDSLLAINPDIVGWIRIDDTDIDYPVVQSGDNQYYLNHNAEKQRSQRGAIFMDYRYTDENDNAQLVIYGHHMKDGSMFGELSKYKDAAYYQEHDKIAFEGLKEPATYQIFSVYIYGPESRSFEYEFADAQQYQAYLDTIKRQSLYDTGVEATSDDQLLTLVTCTYEVTDARLIIHAKRVP
jgi:sortase, SrtB family